jgi:hypothetical protein
VLTDRQFECWRHRENGRGYKATAAMLGCSWENVREPPQGGRAQARQGHARRGVVTAAAVESVGEEDVVDVDYDYKLLERARAALQLVRTGELEPLDALRLTVWPPDEVARAQAQVGLAASDRGLELASPRDARAD